MMQAAPAHPQMPRLNQGGQAASATNGQWDTREYDPRMDQRGGARWVVGGGRVIDLARPVVMGVLNVTPDSFSDGGRFEDVGAALARVREMTEDGAAIVDVGGESTRPGATRVDAPEQIRRVVPVIEAAREAGLGVALSVDTTRANVARAALQAGAAIVNDVSGGTEDPEILPVVAHHGAGVVLMHRLRAPDEDTYSDRYDEAGRPDYSRQGGVVAAVRAALERRAQAALAAGIARESIVLDPGLGFGKTVEQNVALIAGVHSLRELGFPILCGASRKSFLGKISAVEDPAARVHASVAVSVAQCLAGVHLFRVHDVRAHVEALAVAVAIGQGAAGR